VDYVPRARAQRIMKTPPLTEQCPIAYDLMELGELIRIRRYVLGLRLVDAAAHVGVATSVMSRLENGKAVRTDSLVKVLHGLGLAVGARAKNGARFALPLPCKARHEVAGGPVPGTEPSAS
jgi:ribosome-binding protein aMBF1 (putative translation factor)